MSQTVLITGCSSGIGNATANFFADKGWNVAATMRNTESDAGKKLTQLPNVFVTKLDVIDRSSIDSAVAGTIEKFGSLHVVINNAGYGLGGPGEFAEKQQVMSQLETNVYGPLAVTQAVLPFFRSQKTGLILNVGSVLGRMPIPFASVYVASKYAVEGLTEALNLELVPLGIRVKLVEPGVVQTDFRKSGPTIDSGDDTTYDEMVKRSDEQLENEFASLGSNVWQVVDKLYEAATDGTDKVRYPVGRDADKFLEMRRGMNDEEWEKKLISTFHLDK